jgi:hypothetical protein
MQDGLPGMAGKMYGKRHFLYTSATTCSGNRQIALNQFHGRLSGLERVSRLQRFCRHRTGFRQAQLAGVRIPAQAGH